MTKETARHGVTRRAMSDMQEENCDAFRRGRGRETMKRTIGIAATLAAVALAAALSACDDTRPAQVETAPPPPETPVAPPPAETMTPPPATTTTTPTPTDGTTLPPDQRPSEETVKPESETLFY